MHDLVHFIVCQLINYAVFPNSNIIAEFCDTVPYRDTNDKVGLIQSGKIRGGGKGNSSNGRTFQDDKCLNEFPLIKKILLCL